MEVPALAAGTGPRVAGRELLTLLFTDIVGSTEIAVRMGDRRWREVLAAHDEFVRERVGTFGGRVVTPTGDGYFATFEAPSPAIACAADITAATAALGLELRCGIHTGECELLGDNVVGRAVHMAARICAEGEPCQTLVSPAVHDLVAGSEIRLADRGLRELRGIPGSYRLFEVVEEPSGPGLERGEGAIAAAAPGAEAERRPRPTASVPAAPAGPAPPPRRLLAAEAELIGREPELARLGAAIAGAAAGARRTALLTGEPGIGKTALCARLADDAAREGFSVLYGRCEEELQVPFGPFAEALGHLVEHCEQELIAAHIEDHGAVLSHLVPELARRSGQREPEAPVGDPYAIYSAATALIEAASASAPILLVLEDLHWADTPSLMLLRSLIAAPTEPALLALCTCRAGELEPGHPLEALLERFHRDPGGLVLELEGLDAEQIESLFDDPIEGVGAALHQETGGNPYFTLELLRSLAERGEARHQDGKWQLTVDLSGADLAVPGGVRAMIRNRVARLGAGTQEALHAAAVVGREFDAALLAAALGREVAEILKALDPAFRSGLIAPTLAGHASFNHALVAHALYEEIPAGSRQGLHRMIARALGEQLGAEPGARIGELARHLLAAAEPGDERRAFEAALAAGERGLAISAAADAARWFEAALGLVGERTGLDGRNRCLAMIGLGSAQRLSGSPEFRETLLDASRLALAIDEPELLARAAIANTRGFASATGEVDEDRVTILRTALERLGSDPLADRARLLAVLAAELTFSGDWERRLTLSNEALECARTSGDAAALTEVLSARYITIWTPETLDDRDADTAEELELARRAGTMVDRFRAIHWRAAVAIERGRLDQAWSLIDDEARLAARLGQPTALWLAAYDRTTRALVQGRLGDAEEWAREAGRIAAESAEPEAAAFTVAQLLNVAYEQGRLGDMADPIAAQVEANPGIPGFRAALALALCEANLHERARETLAADSADRFRGFAYDSNWLVGLTLYAEVAARLADEAAGRALLELLGPWSGHVAFNAATVWGLVARPLGAIEAALGELDAAVARLSDAAEAHERMAAPTWAARARLDLADALARRGAGGDRERAGDLIARSLATAEDLGLMGVRRRALELGARAGGPQR